MVMRKLAILLGLSLFFTVQSNAEIIFEKQDLSEFSKEIQAEEAQRTPKLTQPTTLAGIAMPAGTQLELLSKNSEGEKWVKPDYFEKAFFPTPVMWQGVPITAMWRYMQTFQDNQDKEPPSFATTRVNWGRNVTVNLAKPVMVDGFNCQKEVEWEYYPHDDEDSWDYKIDARLPAPQYHFHACTSSGQTFYAKDNKMQVTVAKDSRIFSNRCLNANWLDTRLKKGQYLDVWATVNDGSPIDTGLFTLQDERDFGLDTQDKSLMFVFGDIVKSTPECPLKKGSYVQWRRSEPNTLLVYNANGVKTCGNLKVEKLKKLPFRFYFKELIVPPNAE